MTKVSTIALGRLGFSSYADGRHNVVNPARWARAVMLDTDDEHDGIYDHVPPLDIPTEAAGHPLPSRPPGWRAAVTPSRILAS